MTGRVGAVGICGPTAARPDRASIRLPSTNPAATRSAAAEERGRWRKRGCGIGVVKVFGVRCSVFGWDEPCRTPNTEHRTPILSSFRKRGVEGARGWFKIDPFHELGGLAGAVLAVHTAVF